MNMSERDRIRTKIKSIDSQRWWGDDFDVRFYLVSELKQLRKKIILDIGGGIGIISSELNNTNFKINLDFSFEDLKCCRVKVDKEIHCICASMTNLPFKKNCFDNIICANLLEVAKQIDIENHQIADNNTIAGYPTINQTINEIARVLKKDGMLFITTPNNAHYKTIKLTFNELKKSISNIFSDSKIYFFNTYSKFGKNRKLNMANVIPKLSSKFSNPDKIIKNLVEDKSINDYSVSFFVKARFSNDDLNR